MILQNPYYLDSGVQEETRILKGLKLNMIGYLNTVSVLGKLIILKGYEKLR